MCSFDSDYLKTTKNSVIREIHLVDPGTKVVGVFHTTLCKVFGKKVIDMEKSTEDSDDDTFGNAAAASAASSEALIAYYGRLFAVDYSV